jgi:hypothetical protein
MPILLNAVTGTIAGALVTVAGKTGGPCAVDRASRFWPTKNSEIDYL